jgi:hypothetical protein
MVIEERRTNSVAMRVSSRAAELAVAVASGAPVVPAVWVALGAPDDPAELAVWAALVVLESPVAQVALVVPESPVAQVVPESPAVRELETGPVAAPELVINPVVVGPETALVVAAVREADQVEVPLRIKSVTGPRRHDQVLLLTVEDLAAEVVETTLEQAAAEAVKAWEAAE